jgi:hypothetical protein
MELKEWDKAWPFAKTAAESGAQWAMTCAERCAEARGDWKEAGHYAEQVSRQYGPGAWFEWFLFCKRTGHGDVEAARASAEAYLQSADQRPDLAAPAPIGYFYWLCGDTQKAKTWFRNAYDQTPRYGTCLNMILIADEIGDTASRDEALRILLTNYRKTAPRVCRI